MRISVLAVSIALSLAAPTARAQYMGGLQFLDPVKYAKVPASIAPLSGILPVIVDHSASFPPVGQQGAQASCVGWAVSNLKGFQEQQERAWGIDSSSHRFSPSYIYNQIKQPGTNCLQGTWLTDALNLVQSKGDATIVNFPYDENLCSAKPDAAADTDAFQYRVVWWKRLTQAADLDEVRGDLAAGFPVVIGLSVDSAFHDLRGDTIYSGTTSDGGGHALVVVGYDDARRAFHLINSWGTEWGHRGLGWISYASYQARVKEAYISEDLVAALPLTMSVGTQSLLPQPPPVVTLSGAIEYEGNVSIKTHRIVLRSGTRIRVRNGATLELLADEIVVEGLAIIDGTGETGRKGGDASADARMAWVSHTDSDYWAARQRVETDLASPDRGRPGGNGGEGGSGAHIVMSQRPIGGVLETRLSGGSGGPPGNGGSGRLLKNGRSFYCNGCMFQSPGGMGLYGNKGPDGTIQYIH